MDYRTILKGAEAAAAQVEKLTRSYVSIEKQPRILDNYKKVTARLH